MTIIPEFEKMSLVELAEFYNMDWEREETLLEDTIVDSQWNAAIKTRLRSASYREMIDALHEFGDLEYTLEGEQAIEKQLRKDLLWRERERLDALEESVTVLLKQVEGEQANIKVGQLNRLKGGLRT